MRYLLLALLFVLSCQNAEYGQVIHKYVEPERVYETTVPVTSTGINLKGGGVSVITTYMSVTMRDDLDYVLILSISESGKTKEITVAESTYNLIPINAIVYIDSIQVHKQDVRIN